MLCYWRRSGAWAMAWWWFVGTGSCGILTGCVEGQQIGCDFDRLRDLVKRDRTDQQFFQHATDSDETTHECQTVVDNVCVLRPELL